MDNENWELASTYEFKQEGDKPYLEAQRLYFPKMVRGRYVKISITEWDNSAYTVLERLLHLEK